MSKSSHSSAFTLIELMIVIMVMSLMMVPILQLATVYKVKGRMDATKSGIVQVKSALAKFQAANGRLPCPAMLYDNTASVTFGREQTTVVSGVTKCLANPAAGPIEMQGTEGSATSPNDNNVVVGAVPFASLGLSSEQMVDAWGSRYFYAVSKNLASSTGEPKGTDYGQILLQSATWDASGNPSYTAVGPTPGHTPYVVLSVGPAKRGAITRDGAAGPNACSTAGAVEKQNCDLTKTAATFNAAGYSGAQGPTGFSNILSNALSDKMDPSVICGNQGMIYGPGHPKADANGCVSSLVATANTSSGNVGIGTSTPSQLLHIYGTDSPSVVIQSPTNSGEPNLSIYNDANKYIQVVMEGSNRSNTIAGIPMADTAWIEAGGGNLLLSTSAPGAPLIFAPQRTEAMRLTTTGNVGIGTTNPTAKLEIRDDTQDTQLAVLSDREGPFAGGGKASISIFNLDTNNNGGPAALRLGRGPATRWAWVNDVDGNATDNLTLWQAGDHKRMVVDIAGNVGIGTTTPQTALDVAGPIRPGSVSLGSSCTPEGSIAYDTTIHAPVYCSSSLVWTRMSGGGGGGALTLSQSYGFYSGGASQGQTTGYHSFCAQNGIYNTGYPGTILLNAVGPDANGKYNYTVVSSCPSGLCTGDYSLIRVDCYDFASSGTGGGGGGTMTGGSCSAGYYVSAISSTGVPTCTPLPTSGSGGTITGGSCSAGYYVSAISSTGVPTCTPMPASAVPPTCSSTQVLTFNGSSYTCVDVATPGACGAVANGSECLEVAYVTGTAPAGTCGGLDKMTWSTWDVYRCVDGSLTQISHVSAFGYCTTLAPGTTSYMHGCSTGGNIP